MEQEIEVKPDLNLTDIDIDAEMVDELQKDIEVDEASKNPTEGIKLPSNMSKRQQKQLIRMMMGKKPIRANQTKAKAMLPKKKKHKAKSAKAARRKNRK